MSDLCKSKTKQTLKVGSITLEYIVVSTFALLMSLASVAYFGKVIKAKMDSISNKMGVESDAFEIPDFFEE